MQLKVPRLLFMSEDFALTLPPFPLSLYIIALSTIKKVPVFSIGFYGSKWP